VLFYCQPTLIYFLQHNTESDCWLIIGNEKTGGPKVLDVTKYLGDHPGGPEIMLEFAGCLYSN
jgi:cytochrome b involved in lipid metabolism